MDFENVEIVTVLKLRAYRELQNVEIVSVLKLYFVEIVLFFLEGALRALVETIFKITIEIVLNS